MDSQNNANPWLEVQPFVDTILAVQNGKMIKMMRGELTEEYARFDSAEIDMKKPAILFLYIGHMGEVRQKVTEVFSRPIVKAGKEKTFTNSIVINQYKPVKGEMIELPPPTECLITFSEFAAQTLNVTQYLRLDHLHVDKNTLNSKAIEGLRDRGVDPEADYHFSKKLNISLPTTNRAERIINNDMAIVSIFQECQVREITWYKK